MENILNYPILLAVLSFLLMWCATHFGRAIAGRVHTFAEKELEEFNLIIGATLTLLGLIIGFAFSMAVGRYDQRKNYEEEEANAIGTEYVRVDLLSPDDAGKLRGLLREYLEARIRFYDTTDRNSLPELTRQTSTLQNEMWSVVAGAGRAQPTPVTALAVSGMNDVLNRQGYTQAAWWNRIPPAAWALMGLIAIACNLLVGFVAKDVNSKRPMIIFPIVIAVAIMLLADLDSPRGGIIRVHPQNLLSLQELLGH
jgi:hypothetical protein